jgi:hypothetical protein
LRCSLCFKRAPWRLSHACTLSRVETLPSREGSAWHGCLRCPLCFKRARRRPSHACTLSRVETLPSQRLVSLEGSACHGCLRCPLCFKRAPRRPSHACTLSRVETLPSQGLVSLEGSAYLARNRAIRCSTAEAVISCHGRTFLGVAAARARSGRRGQADVTAATAPAVLRRDDGLFAVAWPPWSWWGPPVSEKEDSLQLMRAGRPPRRARPRLINLRGGKSGGFLP